MICSENGLKATALLPPSAAVSATRSPTRPDRPYPRRHLTGLPDQVFKQPEVARGLVADLTPKPRKLLGKEHHASG